jgi:hypothetical protein
MTNKPASVFEWMVKLFDASGRGRALQRDGDLAHQFALVAPSAAERWLPCRLCNSRKATKVRCTSPRRARCPEGIGHFAIAQTVACLAQGRFCLLSSWQHQSKARPEAITAGMCCPTQPGAFRVPPEDIGAPCSLANSGDGRAPALCPVSKPIPSLGRLEAGAEDDQEADLGF